MELGEKLRQARLEAGLSQRQLCGERITRNMLSQIEHGSARPSMDTLRYLARQLGKPVSYFLEEEGAVSPNQAAMEAARACYDASDPEGVLEALEEYRGPDPIFQRERDLLRVLAALDLAEKALAQGRELYAGELLERTEVSCAYCAPELERRRLLLLGRLGREQVSRKLPSLDPELSVRSREAAQEGRWQEAGQLLDAAGDKDRPRWNLDRGQVFLALEDYAAAARHLHRAEEAFPAQTAPLLERCYREMNDYRMAYEYACRQKAGADSKGHHSKG